jgi:hypothetical protein
MRFQSATIRTISPMSGFNKETLVDVNNYQFEGGCLLLRDGTRVKYIFPLDNLASVWFNYGDNAQV